LLQRMRKCNGEKGTNGQSASGQQKEYSYAMRRRELNQDRTGNRSQTPRDIQQGEETCARGLDGGANDHVSCREPGTHSQADTADCNGSCAEAYPRHHGTSYCGDCRTIENAVSEVTGGEPCSDELTKEACGKEASCLRVLDLPALCEPRQKRPQHDGRNACCQKVKEDRPQHTKGACAVVAL
jgi:hypothetical protein